MYLHLSMILVLISKVQYQSRKISCRADHRKASMQLKAHFEPINPWPYYWGLSLIGPAIRCWRCIIHKNFKPCGPAKGIYPCHWWFRLLGYHCVPSCNYTYVRAKLCLIGMSTIFSCDFAFAPIFSMGFVASAHFYHTFVAGSMINVMRLPTLDFTLLSSVLTCMPRQHHLFYSEVMIGRFFICYFFTLSWVSP